MQLPCAGNLGSWDQATSSQSLPETELHHKKLLVYLWILAIIWPEKLVMFFVLHVEDFVQFPDVGGVLIYSLRNVHPGVPAMAQRK